MATIVECDIVLESTGETLGTARFPQVPRVGDEMELDLKGGVHSAHIYRILRVRYHLRPRTFTMRADDVYGVTLMVDAVG